MVGAVLQAAAFSLGQMTVGRFIIGLGVGSAAMIIPLYSKTHYTQPNLNVFNFLTLSLVGELAPARYRGRMIAFDNMSVTLGQLVSYALGAGFTNVAHGMKDSMETFLTS